ncbi:DNA primase [Helicobacter sp. 11S02629-2]|uniref:DNA primase n=1 Tax=Helicobacter sp. 11S02629-2 TaxID=1476195 RepID=UPI000BA576B7|nr:DNA primase [Helicobacter sp. 11S02629-2]PAF42742.1 DNA primase [Helicobacter sp. 11S02629-2]
MIKNLEEFKSHINIVDVISHYMPLRKSGSNYQACCPFHEESTPSFSVHEKKGIFTCFGCGAKGDAIKFVQDYKGLDFSKACLEIANIINFNLVYDEGEVIKYKDVYKLLSEYASSLLEKEASKYFEQRGLSKEVITHYELGVLPLNYEIVKFFESKDALKDAIARTLLSEGDNGLYTIFANRYLFPIKNKFGKVIAFSGRAKDKDKQPKYINSKASSLYNKSFTLYGFYEAKELIAKSKRCYVVEGYMDAISLYSLGAPSVAVCGTAFTLGHLGLFEKDIELNFLFDNDKAGKKATLEAVKLCLKEGFYNANVVSFSDKTIKDANDLLLKAKSFEDSIKSLPILKYYILGILQKHGFKDDLEKEKKALCLKEVTNFLNSIQDNFLKQSYKEDISKLFKTKLSLKKQAYTQKSKSYDELEATLIKSSFLNDDFVSLVKLFTDESMFLTTKEAYKALVSDSLNSDLKDISEDESIYIEPDFYFLLSNFLKKDFEKKKQEILDTSLALDSKLAELKVLEESYKQKQSELMPF